MARTLEDILRVQIGGLTLEVAAQIARAEAAEEKVKELEQEIESSGIRTTQDDELKGKVKERKR